MSTKPFPEIDRFDATDKVTGRVAYGADVPVPGLLHAMTVPATIAKGTVTRVDATRALRVPGVVRVLTYADMPPPPAPAPPGGSGAGAPRAGAPGGNAPSADRPTQNQGAGASTGAAAEARPRPGGGEAAPPTMLDRAIAFRGQTIALVVAETLEAAIEGAEAVRATYAPQPFAARVEDADGPRQDGEAPTFGDADRAFATATTIVDETYVTTANHHNPLELLSTTAVWSGGRLTLYEGTQGSSSIRSTVARLLHVDPATVDVVSPQVGGGFGLRGEVPRHSAVVAHAARLIGRPIKLVLPRYQMFHVTRFRPRVEHRVRIGATAGGRMVAAAYDSLQQNSRTGRYRADWYHAGPSKVYGIRDYRGTCGDIRLDTPGPGQMRAPYEHPAAFAFESAVDELAYKLDMDPVALRMANDTTIDPSTGRRLTSRSLNACLAEGAKRFGWSRRRAAPGSMRAPDGTLTGYGVGAGIYQAAMHPAIATLRIGADGTTYYASAGHEMGQGMRTAIAQALITGLRIDPAKLTIVIGDTRAAPQQGTAGSWGTASSVPVAAAAAQRMTAALDELLAGRRVAGNMHEQLARLRRPFLQIEATMTAPGQGPDVIDRMRAGAGAIAGMHGVYPEFTALSYIAHFVEVRVEPRTRRIRVPRVVSVAECGRVVSPRTARSQVQGGVVWALGAALRETTEVDPRYGGWLNADIAEYHVSVNADIGEIDVSFIDQPDFDANSTGVKGLGEIAMVGAAAALANAVHHATGRRHRTLPIRLEHLL